MVGVVVTVNVAVDWVECVVVVCFPLQYFMHICCSKKRYSNRTSLCNIIAHQIQILVLNQSCLSSA